MMSRSAAKIFALTFCVLFATGVRIAEANDNMPLDQIGAVCVPDGATMRAGLYETRGFGIGFSGSSTGTIRLMCPFPVSADMLGARIGVIMLSVIDDDGAGTGARIQAVLRRAAIGSNVAITITTCDSNTSSFPGPHNLACFFPAYTIKINESYWWDVSIERNTPKLNVEFLSVGIRGAA